MKKRGQTGRPQYRVVVDRFRHLGLQKRIMLYVVVGLAVMFGVVAVLGLSAIDQATQLVYRERLTTAHTTAGILERDFARVGAAVEGAGTELFPGSGSQVPAGAATRLLARFERYPEFTPFFLPTARIKFISRASICPSALARAARFSK